MRKIELIVKALLILFIVCVIGTCENKGTLHEKYLFDEEYWGEWIRMDNGDTWYFASNYRTVNNNSSTSLDNNMTMERQSQNVIKITEGTGANKKEYFLYASRIRNSTFEGTAVKDDTSSGALSLRDIYVPKGYQAVINSKKNGVDKQTVEIGEDGKIEAENIIAGDNYKVTIDSYEFEVTPNTDGDNVGTLTLTNGVNIKTSIVPKSSYYESSVDLMRLFSGESYDLTIKFTNVGKVDSTAMDYNLVMPPELQITANNNSPTRLTAGELQTIEPGKTREVNITVACKAVTDDYELKEIKINTEDFFHKKWDDSVSLRINKTKVTFNVRSTEVLNGVVIVPNGKTYYFRTERSYYSDPYAATVVVPKYKKDYLIVFSGASADTEPKYSFAVDKVPASDFSNYPLSTLSQYWPNGTEGEATSVTSDQEVRAYLLKNKANYYKVKFRN